MIYFPFLRGNEINKLWRWVDQDGDMGGSWTPSSLPKDTPNVPLTQGIIISERNPETSWLTPIHWANENTPTLKMIGKEETYSRQKPHPISVI